MRFGLSILITLAVVTFGLHGQDAELEVIIHKSNEMAAQGRYEEAIEYVKDEYYERFQPNTLLLQIIELQELFEKDEDTYRKYQDNLAINNLLADAEVAVDLHQYDKAISLIEEALQYDPENGRGLEMMSEVRKYISDNELRQGLSEAVGLRAEYEFKKAIKIYQTLLQVTPNNKFLLQQIKDCEDSIAFWNQTKYKYPEFYELMKENKIAIGMPDFIVRRSFGIPKSVNRTVTASRIHEQWVYANTYLYFDDGVLTSWQETIE